MENMISMVDIMFLGAIVMSIMTAIRSFKIKKKWLQLLSIGVGVIFGLVYLIEFTPLIEQIKMAVLGGIMIGLYASGLYSFNKSNDSNNK